MPDPAPKPLTEDEERAWRSLIRLMVLLPRAIDVDLARRSGLSLTRYVVLMRLSEAPDRELRMSDLAEEASLSPSRMTRIIQSMSAEGLVTRAPVPGDARATRAQLTDAGLALLEQAWPAHLAGVRSLVVDQLESADLPELERMVEQLLRAVAPVATGDCETRRESEAGPAS